MTNEKYRIEVFKSSSGTLYAVYERNVYTNVWRLVHPYSSEHYAKEAVKKRAAAQKAHRDDTIINTYKYDADGELIKASESIVFVRKAPERYEIVLQKDGLTKVLDDASDYKTASIKRDAYREVMG